MSQNSVLAEDKPVPVPSSVRILAGWHIDAARTLLLDFAAQTDQPEWGAVDAADCLDTAAEALAIGFRNGDGA
jgi:hypothetical protein